MNQNNNNKVDAVVREALQVFDEKEPAEVEPILAAYRAHIELQGAINTRFKYPHWISNTGHVKHWFDKQGYIIEIHESFVQVDTIEDRFAGYDILISKRV